MTRDGSTLGPGTVGESENLDCFGAHVDPLSSLIPPNKPVIRGFNKCIGDEWNKGQKQTLHPLLFFSSPAINMKEKLLTTILCILGIGLTYYGMTEVNHWAFVSSIILIIGGYLLIRKKLKESISEREEDPFDNES